MNRRVFIRSLVAGAVGIAIAPQLVLQPSNQSKYDLVKLLLANAIEAHDNAIENVLYQSRTIEGYLTIRT